MDNKETIKTFIKDIKRGFDKGCEQALKQVAKDLCEAIYSDKRWVLRYGNLTDSYGWLLAHNGKIIAKGYLEDIPIATEPKVVMTPIEFDDFILQAGEYWGREYLNETMDSYQLRGVGYEIVIFAAMYYAYELQEMDYLWGFLTAKGEADRLLIQNLAKSIPYFVTTYV